MEIAASVLVGLAMVAALAVVICPPAAWARTILTALVTTSAAVTVAVIAAPYIH